ncbi:MAG: tyrosine-type recombinase/integrase [Betaproteobacteria bacterium]
MQTRTKLTKTAIDAAIAADKDVFLWCNELPRFGVRVARSGRKTYVARYRNEYGQSRMITIARTCDMPPNQARDLARKVFSTVATGVDVSAERQTRRDAPTVHDLYQRYDRERAQPYKKPSTRERDESIWKLHILPRWGTRRVASLTQEDVTALHIALKDKPTTANRALAVLSNSLTFARRWKWYFADNPCKGVERFRENRRERILTRDEIARLFAALDEPQTPRPFALLIRLLLLTGCRLGEIRTARVEWIDWERRLLLLPDSKTGQRRVSLPLAAMELLEVRRGEQWVIQGRLKGTHLQRPYDRWREVCRRANIRGCRPHDLRHTVGSYAHMAGLTQREIAELLGHRQLITTERYLHGFAGDGVRNVERVANVLNINAL